MMTNLSSATPAPTPIARIARIDPMEASKMPTP
jgi:hypothetical protein